MRSPALLALLSATPLWLGGAVLSVAACSSNDGGLTKAEHAERYYETALRYYYMKEFARAQDQAEKGLQLEPKHVDLRVAMARILQQREGRDNILRAERLYRGLLSQAKDDPRVFLGLAEVLERKAILYRESADEIESQERLVSEDPTERARELRADAKEFLIESDKRYEKSLDLRDGLEAVNGMQRVNSLLEEFEASYGWSLTLLSMIDDRVSTWRTQLAVVEIRAEEEAKYRALISEDEDLELATRLFAASTLAQLNRHLEAIDHLNRVLELDPDFQQAYSRRGWHQFKIGQYERAIDSLDEFLKRAPIDSAGAREAWDLRDQSVARVRSKELEGG